MHDKPTIFILIAHGVLKKGVSHLFLESDTGLVERVEGAKFVTEVGRLDTRPLLIILASCQSAGDENTGDENSSTLSSLGSMLSRIGIFSVLGFQGLVSVGTVKVLLPKLITELKRDGQIDRALAVARAKLGENSSWWQAVLWLRADGRLWRKDSANKPKPIRWIVGLLISVVFLLTAFFVAVGIWFPEMMPQAALPAGAWNIVVAEPGLDKGDGIVKVDPQLSWLNERLKTSVGQIVMPTNWRSVPVLSGSLAERERKAAAIAERTSASVVVSGFMKYSGPDNVQFQPEIFISSQLSDTSLVANEIVGSYTFGQPITITIGVTSDAQDDGLNRRLTALQHFLNGTKYYIAEQYDNARSAYAAALKSLDTDSKEVPLFGEEKATAVIYEFLAATELGSEHYDSALRDTEKAHKLWPDYARPYLTRGSILYTLSNKELQTQGSSALLPSTKSNDTCFSPTPQESGALLMLAMHCYDDALQLAEVNQDRIDLTSVDMFEKVALKKADILILLARYNGGAYWDEARDLVGHIIEHYEAAQSDSDRQRLRRLAAHAYHRRGLINCIAPNTTRTTCTTALADYEQSIYLLEHPRPNYSCAEKIDLCYPSDQPFITRYRNELTRTKQAISD